MSNFVESMLTWSILDPTTKKARGGLRTEDCSARVAHPSQAHWGFPGVAEFRYVPRRSGVAWRGWASAAARCRPPIPQHRAGSLRRPGVVHPFHNTGTQVHARVRFTQEWVSAAARCRPPIPKPKPCEGALHPSRLNPIWPDLGPASR